MIKATRNQLANVSNPYQGKKAKLLIVCSAGVLRSPTSANIIHKELGYNTRACGAGKTMREAYEDWLRDCEK